MSSVRKPFRKPTSSAFGSTPKFGTKSASFEKKSTTISAPAPDTEQELKTVEKTLPSYAFADKQKGAIDVESEQHSKEDDAIRESQGKNKLDPEQSKTTFVPPKRVVKDNERDDQPSTETSISGSDDFQKYWALVTDYDLEDEMYSDKNSWTPNSLAMFEILNSTASFAYDNRFIKKDHADYLDYAVACYYSIIFYIQILRAKEAAGNLTGPDSSFYRRFFRKFKPEELPISGVLVPYFSTIVSTLLPDSKYNWIMPDYNVGILQTQLNNLVPNNGAPFLQPMVPYMLGILRFSIQRSTQNALNQVDGNGDPIHFDDDDRFIVHRLERAAPHNFFNMPLQQHIVNGTANSNSMLSMAGISYPFNADFNTMNNAAPFWRKSSFKNFPISAVPSNVNGDRVRLPNGNLAHCDDRNKTLTALDDFLCMERSSDLEWFLELVRQAGIHARCFKTVKTLSDIPTTGGLETLICCDYVKVVNNAAFTHPDVSLGLDTQNGSDNLDWYPTTLSGYNGQFKTTREGTIRQEVLQAFTFGTNGSINITHNAHRVGAEHDVFRVGDYWNNNELAATKFADAATLGVPMFRGWRTMHQSKSAVVRPAGY